MKFSVQKADKDTQFNRLERFVLTVSYISPSPMPLEKKRIFFRSLCEEGV